MKRNFAFKLSHHGFLLVEHLMAIIITGSLVLLILSFIQVTRSYASNVTFVSQNQIDALATQLQIESKTASYFKVSNPNELELILQNGTSVTYRIQNQKLIRQLDGKGGEVALYHCHGLQASLINESSASLQLQTPNQTFHIYLTTLTLPLPTVLSLELDEDLKSETDIEENYLELESSTDLNLEEEGEFTDEIIDSPEFDEDSTSSSPDDRFEQELETDFIDPKSPLIPPPSPDLDYLDEEVILTDDK